MNEIVERLLDKEQQDDLKQLTKMAEFSAFLLLFRRLESEVIREFEGFKTAEEAFELRGKLKGFRLSVDIVTNLYARKSEHVSTRSVAPRDSSPYRGAIEVPANPADESESGPVY